MEINSCHTTKKLNHFKPYPDGSRNLYSTKYSCWSWSTICLSFFLPLSSYWKKKHHFAFCASKGLSRCWIRVRCYKGNNCGSDHFVARNGKYLSTSCVCVCDSIQWERLERPGVRESIISDSRIYYSEKYKLGECYGFEMMIKLQENDKEFD